MTETQATSGTAGASTTSAGDEPAMPDVDAGDGVDPAATSDAPVWARASAEASRGSGSATQRNANNNDGKAPSDKGSTESKDSADPKVSSDSKSAPLDSKASDSKAAADKPSPDGRVSDG